MEATQELQENKIYKPNPKKYANRKKKKTIEDTYDIKDTVPLEIGLGFINTFKSTKERFPLKGTPIKFNSLRLRTFLEKGCTCKVCGRKGTHFKIQKNKTDRQYHIGLWSDDDVQMTKDHIIPKSAGGKDAIDNMQTLCMKCNVAKGSQSMEEFLKSRDKR